MTPEVGATRAFLRSSFGVLAQLDAFARSSPPARLDDPQGMGLSSGVAGPSAVPPQAMVIFITLIGTFRQQIPGASELSLLPI